MTASESRRYGCAHCAESFTNPVALGGHVHANHPEHRRSVSTFLPRPLVPARGPRPGGSLKRVSDSWPGRP